MGSPKARGKHSEIVKITHRNEGIMNVSEKNKYMGQFTICNNINGQFKAFYHVSEVISEVILVGYTSFWFRQPPLYFGHANFRLLG